MEKKIVYTNMVGTAIDDLTQSLGAPKVVAIADANTAQFVLPLLRADSKALADAQLITVRAGEDGKSLDELKKIWLELTRAEATRSVVAVNVGGGVVTDIGGFAAATFKRGMRFINVPTTVLGAVDAAFGGKTGINFNGLKNQIGAFAEPEATIISTIFFNTLPKNQILSGYAEMLKHGLLESDAMLAKLLAYSPVYPSFDSEALLPLIQESSQVKLRIVDADPREGGLRKVLNLGHTVGHAIESYAFNHSNPVSHGYAVAQGLVTALVLSHLQLGFPSDTLHKFAAYIRHNYGPTDIQCKDYPELLALMRNDKKNIHPGQYCFTLLRAVGDPVIDCPITEEQITPALDITCDLLS